MSADVLNIEIAGINFAVRCNDAEILRDSDPAYASFLRDEQNASADTVNIHIECVAVPDTGKAEKIFDSEQSWSMFRNGAEYIVALNPPAFGKEPVLTARFDHGFRDVAMYVSELLVSKNSDRITVPNPVRYPLDQILLMYFLAQGDGAILHAAGVCMNGRSYVFPGRSGAGKSTLSRQFALNRNAEPLSDDRVVVRGTEKGFTAFGTPWPGEEGVAVNKGAPLAGIFFIVKGSENRIEEIAPKKSLERLLPVVSIPWYDRDMTTTILGFCDNLISTVLSYELYCTPEVGAAHLFERFVSKD